jgi:hypothetical protein
MAYPQLVAKGHIANNAAAALTSPVTLTFESGMGSACLAGDFAIVMGVLATSGSALNSISGVVDQAATSIPGFARAFETLEGTTGVHFLGGVMLAGGETALTFAHEDTVTNRGRSLQVLVYRGTKTYDDAADFNAVRERDPTPSGTSVSANPQVIPNFTTDADESIFGVFFTRSSTSAITGTVTGLTLITNNTAGTDFTTAHTQVATAGVVTGKSIASQAGTNDTRYMILFEVEADTGIVPPVITDRPAFAASVP